MKIIKPSFVIEDIIDGKKILKSVEHYGRKCYQSEWKITENSAPKFVQKYVIELGHETMIEHEKVTVTVVCDRGITHEIVRHRIASYSQESTRYCNYSSDKFGGEITVIEPCFWNSSSEADKDKWAVWGAAMRCVERAYLNLINLGATAQEARSVLPNSLKTEIVMTMNLREWRYFFRLRCSLRAHPQMREITIPLLKEFKSKIPVIFDDINPE